MLGFWFCACVRIATMVNTIAKSLPADASATELNRHLMEAMMQEEKAAIHTYAANILNAEAKKIM